MKQIHILNTLKKMKKYIWRLKAEKNVLNQFFDFIPLNSLSSDIIVSEDFKNAIEAFKLVGFVFNESD